MVNRRLNKEERLEENMFLVDPAYPKVQWPTALSCPGCWKDSAAISTAGVDGTGSSGSVTVPFDKGAVFAYLLRYYGATMPPGGGTRVIIPAADVKVRLRNRDRNSVKEGMKARKGPVAGKGADDAPTRGPGAGGNMDSVADSVAELSVRYPSSSLISGLANARKSYKAMENHDVILKMGDLDDDDDAGTRQATEVRQRMRGSKRAGGGRGGGGLMTMVGGNAGSSGLAGASNPWMYVVLLVGVAALGIWLRNAGACGETTTICPPATSISHVVVSSLESGGRKAQ